MIHSNILYFNKVVYGRMSKKEAKQNISVNKFATFSSVSVLIHICETFFKVKLNRYEIDPRQLFVST